MHWAESLSTKQQIEPEEISQDEPTYRLDGTAGSTTMIISFAVFPAPGGKSAFDFVRATNPLQVQKLFLRDPNMMWYQKGTPGVGNDVPAVVEYVRGVIVRGGVTRVVMIGNSGGGFSAILFGALVGADEIHAFNPPTKLLEESDTSCPEQLNQLAAERGLTSPYLDLRRVLREHLQPKTKIYIHYSRGDGRDKRHARYLVEFPNVQLIQYPFVSHHVARFFAERAMLSPLLQAAVDGNTEAVRTTTRTMIRTAAPTYIPSFIGLYASKVRSRLKRIVRGQGEK